MKHDARELANPVLGIIRFYLIGQGVSVNDATVVAASCRTNCEIQLGRQGAAERHVEVIQDSHFSDRDDAAFEHKYR